MTPMKRVIKADITKPQSGIRGKAYEKVADLFFRGEFPNEPEPKTKRVLTELEKEFWFGV